MSGIHHVTAVCGKAARNVDFYTRILGFRLVKKAVNFDDPGMYHLYYGDGLGSDVSIKLWIA
jgi:glyoxalase family protein